MTEKNPIIPGECRFETTHRIEPDNEAIFSEQQAVEEARRCLGNHSCDSCDLCRLVCPELCITKDAAGRIQIDLDYCKGCGICAFICPRKAIRMERED